jgi:hypothetical protein
VQPEGLGKFKKKSPNVRYYHNKPISVLFCCFRSAKYYYEGCGKLASFFHIAAQFKKGS